MFLMGISMGSAAGATTSVDVPAAIDASGGRDVTAELDLFFKSLKPDTIVNFPNNGRFRVEGVVTLLVRRKLTIEGHGSTLMATTDGSGVAPPFFNYRPHWPRTREHVVIRDSSDIVVHDLTVQGPNRDGTFRAELEAQAGFDIIRSQRVTLDGITARATYGDGVYVVGASADVVIKNCTLDHNGRQGVAVVAGERVTVQGCTISDTGRSAIDLEPGHGMVRTVHIQDNHVNRTTNFLLAAVGAGVGVQDVWLERNTVQGGKGVSVFVGTERSVRPGIHVIDNTGNGTSKGFEGALMRFTRFDGIEVRGNHQRVANGVTPVLLHDSCNAKVSGNEFPDVSASATVQQDGDCSAPIKHAVRPSTTTRPGGTTTKPPRPTSTVPPVTPTVAPSPTHKGSRGAPAATVAVAVLIGALAGIGGTLLAQWARANRADDDDTDSDSDTHTDDDSDSEDADAPDHVSDAAPERAPEDGPPES